ncbi:NEDD8-activating enzyme E1 regulatory subunit isoform X1 [Bacillus rossius redtenbacheri]|uniref:NEDD8-activating enzyme E1 regulatory subunit isoform X1 n=1 Tax=Bacillus rossius redtenbacheri TaxID=93214 RepID=UPI002FDE8B60
MASPAPKSPEQSEKSKKYDRQLRLWGDDGQVALEQAKVCLVNATSTGTEILKSLILPGVGAFTIVDGKKITEEDIGCNFFLDADSCGQSRAQVATQLLLELNADVRGDYVDENVDVLLENSPDFFNSFTVVIGTSLTERLLILLSKKLWDLDIPFVVCQSYGFVGYIRLQFSEHTVVEAHPDNEIPDLRLDAPFPELKRHLDSVDLETMGLKDHAHVPYVIVLYKYLEKWRGCHDGRLPCTYREKEGLRELIRSGILTDEEGVPQAEENFEEAIKAVNYAVLPTVVPPQVQKILDDDCCVNLTSESKPFWVMAKALRDFVESEGQGRLPVRGAIPDMTADTQRYISLQQVYHGQASKDAETVFKHVQQLLHQLSQPADTVSEKDVRLFCKHAANLHAVRGTSVADECAAVNRENIASALENPESTMIFYIMLRGVDRFYAEYNMYPGEFDNQVEPDIAKLKACISKLLVEWGCGPFPKDDYVHEICRCGAAELHSVAAFVGGCAAQETIKLITHQYKPLNNTFIYDGITSNTATYAF